MKTLNELEPKEVWHYFSEICKIPRPSKKEQKMIEYLTNFGKKHKLDTKTDATGNVLIKKPATPGMETHKPVILQSHIDMVCEKNNSSNHDFLNDAIIPVVDGDWVKAKDTTLGADDGIGVATQLAILASKNIVHPAIDCLFTVDEETGLTGAFAIKPEFLPANTLINLDSEDEGEIFIGCAGGIDTIASFSYWNRPTSLGSVAYKIEVKGLRGGHSGDDINKGYGNAIKILNRFLWNATIKYNMRINKIDGGNLRNAIAREAWAIVTIKQKYIVDFDTYFSNFCKEVFKELKGVEKNILIEFHKVETPRSVMKMRDQVKLLNAIYACPHGPVRMSTEIPGLVETSNNLASVKYLDGNIIEVVTSQRSSVDSSKTDIANMVASVFNLAGAVVVHTDGYPGWKPNKSSEILEITSNAYQTLFNKKPEVKAIHAGLECGLFLEKKPSLDMISIGPTLRNVHSPDEKINIPTVEKFYNLLIEVLKNMPVNK